MIQSPAKRTPMDPCTHLLRTLVSIDSVNPSLVPGARGERDVAMALADHMRTLGLEVHVQDAADGRPNVIGVLDTKVPGPTLMFCGHTDTVGVEGMREPFSGDIRDGRLYGRGSQDMKGGVAAMVDAARVARDGGFARGKLILACVVDEEYASIGADALVRDWQADAAVVTEPTDLKVGVGHKGFAWFEIETRGRAAHGSRPKEGRDAIMRMGRVLHQLEALDRKLQKKTPHPVMGTGSVHASIVEGGREWSVYPDRCVLKVERRTITTEPPAWAEREIVTILDDLKRKDAEFEGDCRLVFSRPPYETPANHPLIDRLRTVARARGAEPEVIGMSFWTDAAILGAAGIPTVLFGPGGAGLHSVEEYVNVEDVLTCRDVLAGLALEYGARA